MAGGAKTHEIPRRPEPFLRLDRADWIAVTVLTLLAAGIRFHDLGSESLWLDEATTYRYAHLPFGGVVRKAIAAGHTPTYFVLMHFWVGLGSSEFLLRTPSVILGVLVIPLCYALGKLVAGRRAAIVTALLVAISTFQVHYAQEARSYALLTLCAAAAMLGLVWLVGNPERALLPPREWWRRHRPAGMAWLGFALGTLGALATHNMAIFFLIGANGVFGLLALRLRSRWSRLLPNWLRAHAVILAVWVWWWPVLFRQGGRVVDHFWIPEPSVESILSTLSRVYLDGPYGVLSLSLPFWALLGTWTLRRRPLLLAALVTLVVAAPLAILAFGLLRPLFLDKAFIWTAIPFFVLAACGIAAIRPKLLFAAALAILLAEGAVKLDRYYDAQTKPDWRRLTRTLAGAAEPNALVLVMPGGLTKIIDYYLPRLDAPPGRFAMRQVPGTTAERALADVLQSGRPIWLVIDLKLAHAIEAAKSAAILSEQARDGRYAIYRLAPHE